MGNSIYEMIGYIIIAGFAGTIILGILIQLFEYFAMGIIFLIIIIVSMFTIHIMTEYGIWILIMLGIILSVIIGVYIFRKVKRNSHVK